MSEERIVLDEDTCQKEETNVVYCSDFSMSKELYYDFGLVGYQRFKKSFAAVLICFAVAATGGFLSHSYELILASGVMAVLVMALGYIKACRSVKIGWERSLIPSGEAMKVKNELGEEKIFAYWVENRQEISYDQVAELRETNSFLLLHLKHGVHITLEKKSLNADVNAVKAFLLDKCTKIKKKRFVNCSCARKWCMAMLVAEFVLFVGTTILSLMVMQ